MSWFSRIFRRGSIYSDLAEEMRLHLEERTEQLMREGMSRKEAEQAARRAFGNRTAIEERSREIWQWPTLESIWADVRYSLRQLRKSPGFTITVVISLTLGLGANTTIFTFVNAMLLRPPAVADAGHLVEVMERNPKASGIDAYMPLSNPGYTLLRDHNRTLSGFTSFDGDPRPVSWSHDGQGQMVFGQLVSSNFFSVLEVEPSIGRFFQPEEDKNRPRCAHRGHQSFILAAPVWRRSLGHWPRPGAERSQLHRHWRDAPELHRHPHRLAARFLDSPVHDANPHPRPRPNGQRHIVLALGRGPPEAGLFTKASTGRSHRSYTLNPFL